jgi:hypothetical protein
VLFEQLLFHTPGMGALFAGPMNGPQTLPGWAADTIARFIFGYWPP